VSRFVRKVVKVQCEKLAAGPDGQLPRLLERHIDVFSDSQHRDLSKLGVWRAASGLLLTQLLTKVQARVPRSRVAASISAGEGKVVAETDSSIVPSADSEAVERKGGECKSSHSKPASW
jgi:hypothetical protein